jgi:hypothetical protein
MRRLALDFDGVLHRYSRGWHDGTCYDVPVEGAEEACRELASAGWELVVVTAREDQQAIRNWLSEWAFPPMEVTSQKVPAVAYVDDRAVRFTNWPDIRKLWA